MQLLSKHWPRIAVTLIPLGTAFTFPCVTSLLSRVISRNERGLYMGVQQTFGGLARVIVPLFAGYTYDHFGHSIPFWVSAGLVMVGFFVGLGDPRPPKAARTNRGRRGSLERRRLSSSPMRPLSLAQHKPHVIPRSELRES